MMKYCTNKLIKTLLILLMIISMFTSTACSKSDTEDQSGEASNSSVSVEESISEDANTADSFESGAPSAVSVEAAALPHSDLKGFTWVNEPYEGNALYATISNISYHFGPSYAHHGPQYESWYSYMSLGTEFALGEDSETLYSYEDAKAAALPISICLEVEVKDGYDVAESRTEFLEDLTSMGIYVEYWLSEATLNTWHTKELYERMDGTYSPADYELPDESYTNSRELYFKLYATPSQIEQLNNYNSDSKKCTINNAWALEVINEDIDEETIMYKVLSAKSEPQTITQSANG